MMLSYSSKVKAMMLSYKGKWEKERHLKILRHQMKIKIYQLKNCKKNKFLHFLVKTMHSYTTSVTSILMNVCADYGTLHKHLKV